MYLLVDTGTSSHECGKERDKGPDNHIATKVALTEAIGGLSVTPPFEMGAGDETTSLHPIPKGEAAHLFN